MFRTKSRRSAAGTTPGTNNAVIALFRDPVTMREFYSLVRTIECLNLAGGLQFTPDQAREIIKLLQKGLPKAGRWQPEAYTFATSKGKRYVRALEKAVKRLEGGCSLSENQLKGLAQLREEARQEEIPEKALRDAIIDGMRDLALRDGIVSEERKQGYRARTIEVFEDGRRMTDAEYAMKKDKIYERLSFLDIGVTAVMKLAETEGDKMLRGKIRAYVVNPRMLAVLEAKRAAQAKR